MNTAEILIEDVLIENGQLNEKIIGLTNQNRYLEEQLAWLKRQIFGKRSERMVADSNSTQMFIPGLEPLKAFAEEEKKTVPALLVGNQNAMAKIRLPFRQTFPYKPLLSICLRSKKSARRLGSLWFR